MSQVLCLSLSRSGWRLTRRLYHSPSSYALSSVSHLVSQQQGLSTTYTMTSNNHTANGTSSSSSSSAAIAEPAIVPGSDTLGRQYKNTTDMWKHELQGDLYDPESGWYGKALKYWENTSADMSGVLGGLDELHKCDVPETLAFFDLSFEKDHQRTRALDCAAGIGRVTKHVLAPRYETVDVLEPVPHMLAQARVELKDCHIGEYILGSMQTVSLRDNDYDLIMIQWAAIYLTDQDFVKFFAACGRALRPHGYVVLKENCFLNDKFLVDKDDSSLTRGDAHYKRLFKAAGLVIKAEAYQRNWPDDVIPVKMYALQPAVPSS